MLNDKQNAIKIDWLYFLPALAKSIIESANKFCDLKNLTVLSIVFNTD